MNGPVPVFLRAIRGIREHTWLFVVGVGVIAAALFVLGLYGLVVVNLRAAVGSWRTDVHVTAYFEPGTVGAAREQAQKAVAARPEVDSVDYTDEAAARAWMEERMPDLVPVFAELGDEALPASLEITLQDRTPSGEALAAFAESLQAMGVFEVVDYGEEWVRRFQTFVSLLSAVGLILGAVIAAAATLMVGNTIQLAVHARRDEVEIVRLVGGTDGYILAPFLVEGALEGLLGALVAVAGLYGVHQGLLLRVHEMFSVAFGGESLRFVPLAWSVALGLVGAALGVLAAFVAVQRFLRRVS